MSAFGAITKTLATETSAVYRKPSGFAVDRQQHKNVAMEFHVKVRTIETLPPAIRNAAKLMKNVKNCLGVKFNLWEENFDFDVETGPEGTCGERFHFKGVEGKAMRLFRDKDGDTWLSFQIKAESNKAVCEFMAGRFGDEVRLSAASSQPELPGTTAEPDQKELEFDEVAAQPKRVKAKKTKAMKPAKKAKITAKGKKVPKSKSKPKARAAAGGVGR